MVKFAISLYKFKKIYSLTWGVHRPYITFYPLQQFLKINDIKYKLNQHASGSLAQDTIQFETNEDEAHFIILINSLRNH